MPDESTTEQAYELAEQNNLAQHFPASIRGFFERRELPETPKPGDPRFAYSHYFPLLSNRDAVQAAFSAAQKLGFAAEIDRGTWDADFRRGGALERRGTRRPSRRTRGSPSAWWWAGK